MRMPHPATVICGILSILFLIMAYNAATLPHLTVWFDHHQRTFTRDANPALFWIPAGCALVLAVACSVVTYHLHFRLRFARAASRPVGLRWFGIIMFGLGLLGFLAALIAYALHL